MALAVYLIFYKRIFVESTIKLLQEYLISERNNNSYHDGTSAFFSMFFSEKNPHLNAVAPILFNIFLSDLFLCNKKVASYVD